MYVSKKILGCHCGNVKMLFGIGLMFCKPNQLQNCCLILSNNWSSCTVDNSNTAHCTNSIATWYILCWLLVLVWRQLWPAGSEKVRSQVDLDLQHTAQTWLWPSALTVVAISVLGLPVLPFWLFTIVTWFHKGSHFGIQENQVAVRSVTAEAAKTWLNCTQLPPTIYSIKHIWYARCSQKGDWLSDSAVGLGTRFGTQCTDPTATQLVFSRIRVGSQWGLVWCAPAFTYLCYVIWIIFGI